MGGLTLGHGRTASILRGRRQPEYQQLEADPVLTFTDQEERIPTQDDAQNTATARIEISRDSQTDPFSRMPGIPDIVTTYVDAETPRQDSDAHSVPSPPIDDDMEPLAPAGSFERIDRQLSVGHASQRHDRLSHGYSIPSLNASTSSMASRRMPHLGDDLPKLNASTATRKSSVSSGIDHLSVGSISGRDRGRSRSLSASKLQRAGSILREMSERVVNLSNDNDMIEQSLRRKSTNQDRQTRSTRTRSSSDIDVEQGPQIVLDHSLAHSALPLEKQPVEVPSLPASMRPPVESVQPNPLRGRSLGIFGPDNPLRRWLLNIFTHTAAEPTILVLILIQTVLLAVNAAADAHYQDVMTRIWNGSPYEYALLAIFCVYTLECAGRIIISGLLLNPREYSTLDRSRGFRKGAVDRISSLFAMYDKPDTPAHPHIASIDLQPSIVRSFTGMPNTQLPSHGRQKQRLRLAHRAFLRHSFNRLDFLAVMSYWISLFMQLGGVDIQKHVYVFNMLSCLRIFRLLGLTTGTTIILRSLKKAASSLVNIAFLIGFFWLIFGIVGVQSFKASFRRTCVWVGDDGSGQPYAQNFAPSNIQFCGGHISNVTGRALPWIRSDGLNGTTDAKGFICPENSLCIEGVTNPYNNTVSFDNIVQSMELVFVIISSNTWSDLMYALAASDYLISALFFAVGIVVLALWLVNLLIAVITSSFQVIREESKQSAFVAHQTGEPPSAEQPVSKRKNQLRTLVRRSEPFWIFVIMFDIVAMCLRTSNMGTFRENFIMDTETVVTFLLVFEIILRFVSDWRGFIRGKRNWTDLGLAVITLLMQMPPIHHSGQAYAWLSIFQIARIYRVVLAVPLTRDLVMVVFGNALGILNLILFVVLFTFLASIMASQLFRGDIPQVDNNGSGIEIQFHNIWNSFIGMYIIFSSENWTTILYNVTQYSVGFNMAWLGAAFIILWFIISDLVILNMFIAVIQESFDVSEDEKRLQQIKSYLKQQDMSNTTGGNVALSSMFKRNRDSRLIEASGRATTEQLLKDAVIRDFLEHETDSTRTPRPQSSHLTSLPQAKFTPSFAQKTWARLSGYDRDDPNPFYSHESLFRANEEFDARAVAQRVHTSREKRRQTQRQYLARHPNYNVSLFLFRVDNPVRRICQYVVGPSRGQQRPEGVEPNRAAWLAFSAFTYAAIVAMVVIACVTTPLYQKEHFSDNNLHNNWLVWTDLAFAIIFTMEALIKTIADGFFYTPNAFFRSIWGLIDVVVLVSLWIGVVTTLYTDDTITRGVGALKALRALRLLNISDSARETFHSVIVVGGYKVLSAAFVSMSLLVPFAILGVNLFNGKFRSCNNSSFSGDLYQCVGEFNSTPFNNNWTVLAPQYASNPWYSFDDFGSSIFILFQIVSQEGWTIVLQSAMSVVAVGQQPQAFSAPGNAIFSIVFNLLGTVFVLTLFISVFMRNYTEQTGVAFLTADQRSWLELRKLLKQIAPTKKSVTGTSSKFRKWCYSIASRKRGKWPRFVTTILLAHLGLLVIEFYPEPVWWERLREFCFLAFTLVFMSNIGVRVVGLTWRRYYRSSWDFYSLFAVAGTFVTSLMALGQYQNRAFEQLHKLFLVSITFLLIPRNSQLDQLFKTAAASFNLIANLLATWFVLFLVFAIALTQAFSLTRFGANENSFVNFRTVPKALILLFRTSIGEGWNQIMEDFATIQPPYCVVGDGFLQSDCGSVGWARGLLVAWNLISMYIFTSLFVSLIFESFSYVYQRSGGLSIVTREEVRNFKAAWAEFDPKGTGWVSKERFPRLLGELSGVFQMRIYDGDFTVRNLLEDCSVRPSSSNAEGGRIVAGIDLDKLAERLEHIPIGEIRARRHQMNLFYHEMLLSADKERGMSFTNTLMTLAQYNVTSDGKSLRLEEFLRRRAKLQRVQDSIKRDVVRNFIESYYLRRAYKERRRQQRDSRLDGPPHLSIPEILVEDPEEGEVGEERDAGDYTETSPLSPQVGSRSSTRPRIRINTAGMDWEPSARSSNPLSSPSFLRTEDTSYHGGRERRSIDTRSSIDGDRMTVPTTPTLGGHSRQGSILSNSSGAGLGVADSFDNSAWGESLRRSFTRRRSDA